ncbi:MAG: DnaA/Hda family protein, partial [Saccharofermentans sp.]|nr:DnaA/Hda family protein [Saccharofermentans sp.]
MQDIWSSSLKILNLNARIDDVVFKTVLSKMKQVSYENKILVLSYPDEFTYSCIDNKDMKGLVKSAVDMVSGENVNIIYVEEGNENAAITSIVAESKAIEKEKRNTPTPNGLNGEFTFENFVVGECNKFAQASAISVAENPGLPQRNPLYLWGNSGLGKTHLMKAIGNKVAELYPEKKVLYTTCEEFTNAYVACMHNKVYEDFRNKYRTIDVLLIDDIQFLINKEGTQMEFFNTFES